MMNVFNGPPVSFNRDGGPSLAYGARGFMSGTVPSSNYGAIEIDSQGRPFYLVAASGDQSESIYVQRKSATQMNTSRSELVGTSAHEFGSVDTTSKVYGGWGDTAPTAVDPWIGFDAQAPTLQHFTYPFFCPTNEIITLIFGTAATPLNLSIFWVEIFNE